MQNENEPQQTTLDNQTEPVVVVSDQAVQPVTPESKSDQISPPTERKLSKWRYLFIVLGILQALGVALFILAMTSLAHQAKSGVSGTEFIAMAIYVTLVPAVAVAAFINLIGLPIYMRRHKPQGKGMVFGVLSLTMSVILFLFGAYTVYQFAVAMPREAHKLDQQTRQQIQSDQQKFAAANSKPEITKDEAIQLLQSCQLQGFYYTNQTDKSDPANGGWGELSSTGLVLTKVDGKPYRISIADRLIPELVPIARQAQKTCGGPQFWHDGNYEQYQNGHWYFNGQVVN